MKLRLRIVMLAVLPLLLACVVLAWVVYQQGMALAREEKALVESAWMKSKEAELEHYVRLAQGAIRPLLNKARSSELRSEEWQAQALLLLSRMDFGQDGYFFVYDVQGNSLMHPRQPHLVGNNLMDMRDRNGAPVLANLLAAAIGSGESGELVRYLWQKPSAQRETEKIGYVAAVPQWGWMLGTGLYRDDIDAALHEIDETASDNIRRMLRWVALVAAVCTLTVALGGLVLNLSDHRQSDAKLRQLARRVVQSQEEERARLSRELHDGVSQHLVSIKLVLEAAHDRLASNRTKTEASMPATSTGGLSTDKIDRIEPILDMALTRLQGAVAEIRRISHNLRPALLDDLGLPTALSQLCRELNEVASASHTPLITEVTVHGDVVALAHDQNTALFRIAQESMTNVFRHARADRVVMSLHYAPDQVWLDIQDNGRGFDYAQVHGDPASGVGLRNMRERLSALGGALQLVSNATGTRVVANLPLNK
ncbi:MAG: cache domain-containing protein [Burkholderiaceae bacterium]|nr:cache domain-containing protein [Burkholderiaceae bacterium]